MSAERTKAEALGIGMRALKVGLTVHLSLGSRIPSDRGSILILDTLPFSDNTDTSYFTSNTDGQMRGTPLEYIIHGDCQYNRPEHEDAMGSLGPVYVCSVSGYWIED